jgi:NADH-ubiquinone oxidoreductase chain 6
MLQLLITSSMLALAISLPLASTPLTLGLWVLILALIIATWLSLITLSWFRIILFLIYIRGMLVIFAYFVAITPNYTIPNKLLTYAVTLLFISCVATLTQTILIPMHFTEEILPSAQQFIFKPSQRTILIFLVVLLFLAMVLTVKISDRNQGPLRPFN